MKALLQNEGCIAIVGEAGNVSSALDLLKDTQPNVLLLDIQLGSENGLDILPHLPAVSPSTRVIVLSSYSPRTSTPLLLGPARRSALPGTW